MSIKDKAASFVAEYNRELDVIQERIRETESHLEDLSLEIRFIEEKEIPEAVQRRVLSGDRSQEIKKRKQLEKLLAEKAEKSEDLLVLQTVKDKFKQEKADEIQKLHRLLREEQQIISQERFERIQTARNAYKQSIKTETDLLHLYLSIEVDLQTIEVNAGRRRYVESTFPIHPLKLAELTLNRDEVTRIAKGLK